MIIGNGLIANLFKENDRDDVIIFASGVSNSSETDPEQFAREENLIKQTIAENPNKIFVYFSTCSIYDSSKVNSLYVIHKLRMEEIIKNNHDNHLILRVSNAVGNGGNPNLLLNYILRAIKNNEMINAHTKATRNLIDADDIKNISLMLIESGQYNRIVNVAYPQNFSVVEILEIVEKHFNAHLNLNLIKSGESYNISIPDIENYFIKNQLMYKENYLYKILKKYYS